MLNNNTVLTELLDLPLMTPVKSGEIWVLIKLHSHPDGQTDGSTALNWCVSPLCGGGYNFAILEGENI